MPSSAKRAGPLRTTETGLEMPSLGRVLTLLGRAARLRCPNCGESKVLEGWRPSQWGKIRDRCSSCNFRFTRSDDRYFGGAMLANLLVAELVFALSFLAAVLLTWPAVPWDALMYGGAVVMLALPPLFHPISKVVWLTIDVLVRPVTRAELE
jgi:uncharacterized protein (DUF983 family)